MKFDKTCCGTTCDAKANADYVAKLEMVIREIDSILQDNYYPRVLVMKCKSGGSVMKAFLLNAHNRITAPMEQADAI